MKLVELEDLGERFAERLGAARAGEVLVVVHRGEAVADVRVRASSAEAAETPARGGGPAGTRFALVPNDPAVYRLWPPLAPFVTSAKLLDEERAEE